MKDGSVSRSKELSSASSESLSPTQAQSLVWSWRFDPLDPNHRVEITYGGKSCAITPTLNNASLLVDRLNRHDALLEVARLMLSKSDIRNRWPCTDCGRPDNNAPLRTIEYEQEDGTHVIAGCWLCNTEDVRDAARAALAPNAQLAASALGEQYK